MRKESSEMRVGVRPGEASRQQLTALIGHLQRGRERECAKLAQQVHDELTQNLTVVSMELSLAQSTLGGTSSGRESKLLCVDLARVQKLVAEVIRATQAITTQLRPKVLDEFGLMAALEWLAQRFEARTGIPCHICSMDTQAISRQKIATDVFRLVEEILGKLEADGTETMVRITIAERDGTFSVELQHNGRIKPMEDAEGAEALSVLGMKMRALRLKGTLHIRCDPDCCTVIRIETPLGKAQR